MSRENVALAERAYDAWNRNELEWIEDRLSENFELRPHRTFPDTEEVYRGKDGWRRFCDTSRDAWDEITFRVERIDGDVGGSLPALLTFGGTGRGSGVATSMDLGHVVTIEDGLIAKLLVYESWEAAREAVGLRE
jgi:ketosteroid isomerase-like protein